MRRVFWILPPASGVLAYAVALGWAAAQGGSGAAGQENAAPPLKVRTTAPEQRRAAAGQVTPPASRQELLDRLKGAVDAERQALGQRTPEELREIILRLKKDAAAPPGDRQWQGREAYQLLAAAATELGRKQYGEALAWAMAHAPERRNDVLEGWAQTEPDAAFDAIVHSDRKDPCSRDTLMKLLQGFGDRDPALLKERGAQVRWELFPYSRGVIIEFRDETSSFSFPGQAGPWIKSGMAAELNAKGIVLAGLWSRWMKESPDEALASWLTGEGLKPEQRKGTLMRMLDGQMDQPEIRAALDRLPPQDLARVMAIMHPEEEKTTSPVFPEPAEEEAPGSHEDLR